MNTPIKYKSLLNNLLAASSLGLILIPSAAFSADAERGGSNTSATPNINISAANTTTSTNNTGTVNNNDQRNSRTFEEVDTDSNRVLTWTEVHTVYKDQLREAGWDETMLMNEFDQDQNNQIDMEEYVIFLSGLATEPTNRQAALNERAIEPPENVQRQNQSRAAQQREAAARAYNTSPNQPLAMDVTEEQHRDLHEQRPSAGDSQANTQATANEQDALASSAGLRPMEDLAIDKIENRQIVNMNGQPIGEVSDVVLRKDGAEAGVVVTVDAASDNKQKQVFVDFDRIVATEDKIIWQTPLDSETVREFSAYNPDLFISVPVDRQLSSQ